MIVSIAQPAYLPWLGYYHRLTQSDLHIVLDTVKHSHGSFENRNRIRTTQGWTWLTVPILRGGNGDAPLAELFVDDRGGTWRKKHLRTIEHAYARAPFFEQYAEDVSRLYAEPWERLADACKATTQFVADALGIATQTVLASDLRPTTTKSDLVLELCRRSGATTYLSGPLGRDYLVEADFAAAGIAVRYHDYVHPCYPQAQPGVFAPFMAAIDLLLNCGPERAREIASAGQPQCVVA